MYRSSREIQQEKQMLKDCTLHNLAMKSTGLMRMYVIYFAHVLQAYAMLPGIVREGSAELKMTWSVPLKFLGIVRGWFCWKGARWDELELLISSVVSVSFFCLIFSLHLGLIPTLRLICLLLIAVPVCVAVGSLPGSATHTACVLCSVIVYVMGLYVLYRRSDRFRIFCMYPLDKMRMYCSFGRSGVDDPFKGRSMLLSHLLLAGVPIVLVIFSLWPPVRRVRFMSFLFLFAAVSSILRKLKAVMASKRDIQRLIVSCYYLYCDITYPLIAYELADRLLKGDKSVPVSWSLSIYVFLFRLVLPFVHKVYLTFEVRRLSNLLSDRDYEQAMDNSTGYFSYLFCGVKRRCYWWPVVDHVLRIVYVELHLICSEVLNVNMCKIFCVILVLLRPYRRGSFLVVHLCEPLAVWFVNWATGVEEDLWDPYGAPMVVFLLIYVPVILGTMAGIYFSRAEKRETRVYKAARMDMEEKLSSANKEYEQLAGVRMSLGLSTNVMPKCADDLPVLMTEDELSVGYSGPSHDIIADITRISIGEACICDDYSDLSRSPTREDIAKFHVSLGYDSCIFEEELCDSDLPNNLLIERVEYDCLVITRHLVTYQFPIAALFLCMCCSTWLKHLIDRVPREFMRREFRMFEWLRPSS